MAFAETAQLAVRIDLEGNASRGIAQLNKQVKGLGASAGRMGKGFGQISSGLSRAGLLVGGAVATGLVGAAKAAIDFQDAFQGVVKTVDEADLNAAGLTFDDLSKSLREMATEMPNSVIELSNIAAAAGALGVKGKDIASFTRQVAILASTTNVSADDAATALGQLSNVIGLTGDEYDNFAAALVDLGNKGASTEADILEITRRAGGAAKSIDLAKDATIGWAAAAANLGLNPELGGTALQRFFLQAQSLVSNGKGGLAALGKIAGMTGKQFKKAFEKDASGALESFIKGLGEMPKDARLKAVQELFGKGTGLTRLILGLSDSIDTNLTPSLDTSTQAWKDATAAQIEFDKRNATVKSAILRLKNGIYDAAITIGEGFAPALGRAADKLSAFLKMDGNKNALKQIGEDIGKAIDGIDWEKVLQGAKDFVSVMRVALDWTLKILNALNALPTEIKGAAAGFLALNKLSGGLIGAGVGNVLGGALGGIASRAPGVGKLFAQPVFVTNWPMGGIGAGAGGAAGGISAAAVAGVAASAAVLVGGLVATQELVNKPRQQQAANFGSRNTDAVIASGNPERIQAALDGIKQATSHLSPIQSVLYQLNANGIKTHTEKLQAALTAALRESRIAAVNKGKESDDKIATVKQATDAVKRVTTDRLNAVKAAQLETKRETARGAAFGASATRAGSSMVASAVRQSRPIITTNVKVNVSAAGVSSSVTKQSRYGPGNGSAGGGTGHAPGTGPLQ